MNIEGVLDSSKKQLSLFTWNSIPIVEPLVLQLIVKRELKEYIIYRQCIWNRTTWSLMATVVRRRLDLSLPYTYDDYLEHPDHYQDLLEEPSDPQDNNLIHYHYRLSSSKDTQCMYANESIHK